MKTPALGLGLMLLLPALYGCKAEIESEITVLDLLYGKTKMLTAEFYTEVLDCQQPSPDGDRPGSLAKRRETIAAIFPDAEYHGCGERAGRPMAHFTVPIAFDKDRDGVLTSDDHVNLVSTDDAFLMIAVPSSLKRRIEAVAGDDIRARTVQLDARLKIANDHGNTLPFQVFSVYIDGRPYIFGDAALAEGATLALQLSDVTIDSAIEKGSAILMMRARAGEADKL